MRSKIYGVCYGKILNIENVKDSAFSQKMLGDGIAVIPEDEYIYAPFDGKIESVFPSKHAIIISNRRTKIMIHVGINTVALNGRPFEILIKEKKKVKKGQPLMKVNHNMITENHIDNTVLVIALEKELKNKADEGTNADNNTILFEC